MDKPGLRDALPQPKLSDTRTDPFWSNLDSSLSAAAAPSAAKTPQRDLNVGLGDVARGVGAGALELVGGIGELARQASQFGKENAGKQGGDYLEQARANMASKLSPVLDMVAGAGDLAKSGAESLTDGMSGDAKEAIGRSLIDETPEGRLTMGDGAGDLDVWAMKMAQGVGSMVPTLLAGGVTGAAAKASIGRAVTTSMLKRGATQEVAEAVAAKTVAKLATGAAVTTGATGSVGSAGVNTRESVLGMSFDELSRSDTFRQAFTRIDQDQQTQHLSDEEKLSLAREETANVASRATMSDAKVWGAAAMGSVMGDAMLFKMLAGKAATGGVLKGAAKGAIGEGIGETLEEGVQQYTINESLNEVAAADIDPMKGVVSSALEGGLIGMGTGGALGGAGGLRGSKSQPESEVGAQVDPATAEDVAPVEPGDPMQENPAAAPADPDLAPAADAMADPVVAPSGEQSPLGPSASQFDELRDVPAYLRRDDTAERFKGMAADSEVQRALAGEFGQSVQELVASQMQAGDQGKSLYERAQAGELGLDPFAGNKSAQQVAMENQRPALPLKDVIFAGDANAARGVTKEGHFDDKPAGTGPQFRGAERTRWQSGQEGDVLPPEASSTKPAGELPGAVIEGEAREVGTELPHRDVVYGADQRQPDAKPMRGSATDSVFGPLQTLRITRKGKPFATEKEAAMASRKGKERPVPLNGGGFGVAEIAEVEQVQAANNSNAINGPQGNNQPQAEVSNEPVTPVPAISSEGQRDQPGAGEPAAAGAEPAITGFADGAGAGDRGDLAAPAPVPDGQQQNDPTLTAPATDAGAAVSGRIGEEELRDRDLLKEHGGHWKYRSAVGAGWFTANTKEAAIERAEEAYRKAVSKGEPVPTRDERFAQADAELFSEMDRRYGKMSTPELEAEYQRLGGEVGDLQKSGSGEFNGNGGRRTGAAVSNEGARQVGEERLRLGVYMKMRRDRDTAGSGAKSQQIEPANDWRGAKSATDYHAAKRRLFSGEMEFSEFQAMSRSALDNAPSLRAELEKKTKQDLLDQMSRFNAARYKNDKKAVVVEAAYNQLIGDLRWAANGDGNTISETYAIGGARQSIEERVAKALDGLTPERYQQFVNKQRADVAKRDAELAVTKEALRDPQTIEQFKTFLKYRSLDKLTPEQRARYEDLIAANNLDKRDQAREVKAATAVTPTASGDIIKTKHTKSGEDLYVVQMGDRVDRDTYNQINAHAKKLGGWYSSYKVGGAVPGFQFKDEAKATEFRGWLTGQGAASAAPSAEAAPTEVTDPDQDNSKSKQVETLRTRAKTLRDKATAALNAERKENTNKRMTEAANARANAESELHFAGLLDAIADGIESGEVTYLRNLANGTQLTELNHALSRSLWNLPPARREALTSQGMIERTEDGRERWSAKATPEMMAEGAQMPGMDYFARNLKDVATKMQGASGFKQAGAKIMALVNAAINRDSKTVSITDPELIAKLKAYTSGVSDYDAKAVKEQIDGYSRLERMGITNHTELRAALRELARLQAGLKKQAVPRDPLAEKMVALKRKLVGNRNAFIDFFPTPESHAADLVALAGIEPGMTVLEPSAGHGMLAEAARAAGAKVDAVELAGDLREILQAKGFSLVGSDFMATTPAQSYDAVVMNPPFSDDMDVDHVRHAYDHLKPGGRLVAIVSATAGDRQNNKNKAFREWFDGLGGSEQAMPEGSFKASLNPTDVRTKIFVIDKPANEAKPLPSPEGKRVTVATPKGQSVEVQYRVMEAADLVASHDFEGNLNHDYPQQLQPRDRSKQTYRVQVGQIAAAPDGARLAASPETDRGAPIVRDGIVESGNGRTIGLKQAYQRGDAGAYRAYLLTHATEFGLDAAAIEAMSAPVLVRERLTEMDDQQLRDFVVDSNTDAKMANSAAEDAGADAGKLTDDMLDLLNIPEGGDVLASQNNRFLQAFLSAIGENQSNSYVSRDGQWNDAYRKRVTAAIFAYGYDNQRLLDAATGEVDADGRNITTALINNAVGMAKLRQHSPERAKVISNYLAEAVESIARAKRSGQSLQEMAAQSDMLGGDTSPEGSLLAQAIAASARSAKAITGMVGDILTMLNKTTSADMFGAAVDPATPETAINETLKAISAYNQQKASQPKPGGDLFGLAGARNNHGAAPSVPRSGDASAAKGAGGVTEGRLELDGVSIRIPAIDEEQQRLYNQATHRGQGVNFASGISTGVGRILNDLKDAGLLDTVEQRAAAEAEVQAWANEEAINARKLMRDGIKNPSWAITGRSGRKAQSSAAQDAENRRQAAHHKDQSDRITALRGELKKLRPKEVIGKESFNYAWGKAKGMIADYASAQSNGQPNLLASLRKSMNAELARYLQSMGKIDAPNFIKTLKEQDQRLKAAGHDGLVAIVGARSNPGKIISNAIDGRIRFSKQAMSQGMRPAKHLTRKEAELVTKGWFKQYRGASGIDVQIHATQAELEESLGLDAKEGLIRRAAFDDDAGTLHVAADTISDPKRMREILRHEVLAHYGLANVLGDGEYTKLMSRLIGSQKDPSMKPVWDWVNTHYADEDIGTKAEEVVAHLAELEQGAWGRGWDRVVAWVTRALRAVGFVPDGITAAETRSLIEGLGKKLQRSGPDDSGPDGGKKFSQEAERPANDGGIKMSQSIADNSPSLEQSITQKAKYQAGAALGSVKNYIKQKRPVMLGTLTDLQIDQVYRDITGGAVSEYQRLRTQMEADRNDILLDAETRIDPLWDALDKQVKTALSNLMHDATMTRLHPDKPLDENSYYLEAKQKVERAKKPETKAAYEAELHIIKRNHSELARQYNALPANAKALYDTMQDTYTKQWESLRGAIEQRLEDLLGVNQGRAMAAEMRQKMEHALQHGPYFPLTRYGDYVVKARKGDEYVREHFERRADAEQAVKQYQRDGYNAVMTVKEEGGGDSANANQLGMEMLSFLDSADWVSKSALKDEIWQAMLRMMPDASYAKHAIHRRRVKGASRDAHRAYLNSVYHYARHVSKIRYGHKMQGELDKLSEQIRAGVAGEPSSLKPEDLEIAQQVLNEMNKRHDLNMNPTGKAWAGSAGNIGFLYYIGPSVASAVVNMTQNFTVMLPQLGAKYGFAKSAAAMTQALGDYVKHGKFKAGTTEAWHSLTRSTTLPADERAILDRLYRAGALDLTQAHSIAAKADTDQQDAKPMGKRWRRAMRWAGATFHNAEVLNREVAALAAYRLLKQAEPTLNGQQYADRVAEMVYDGHGNYAASNRPRYMRNDITKVLTQFKIYSQMMTYVLYSNAIKAAKGDKVAQKTLAGVLATHWVMAGVMGLPTPITAVVYAIAAGLDDDDDRSGEASFRLALTEALGPRAGELLAKGPMDALTNLSIAGRTGLGDLWWRSPKEGTEGDDLAWHAVQQLLGPVAGIGINLARGAGQMTDGHIQRGLETMLPKSIRDVAKSYRQATEGEQTIKGDIIMDDVSTWNVAMQGLGFGSAQMAKNYDAREYIKGKEKRIADKRSQLLTDYYMARKSGEMDEVQEVLERIKMFNSINHPRERITGKSLALSFKSKLRSNERTQGGVYLNRNREYLREEGRFAD